MCFQQRFYILVVLVLFVLYFFLCLFGGRGLPWLLAGGDLIKKQTNANQVVGRGGGCFV